MVETCGAFQCGAACDIDIAGHAGRPEVAPGRPGPRANKARVWNENGESVRRMILDIYAPIARRWPRDGAALLTAPPIPRGCVEHPGILPRCSTHLFDIAGHAGTPEVAPGRPGPRANKARVWNENGESVRRMILDIYAPLLGAGPGTGPRYWLA